MASEYNSDPSPRGGLNEYQGHSGDGGLKQGITTSQNKLCPAAPDAPAVMLNLEKVYEQKEWC
jgi:hypothetical protein